MTRILYFDCFAGISGDMTLGALVDAGADPRALTERLSLLGVEGFEVAFERADRSGLSATRALVSAREEKRHRHLADILRIIEGSRLTEGVKRRAADIFRRLAEAEARVHDVAVERIHFHEVGALDAIVDVVGACVGFELLGVERFAASALHVGSGTVEMAHGRFPVPPPAVAELLRGAPVYATDIEGELVTPTGAAIVAAVCESFGPVPPMRVERTGYGAGGRNYARFPNVLRVLVGELEDGDKPTEPRTFAGTGATPNPNYATRLARSGAETGASATTHTEMAGGVTVERLFVLETNLDDASPQVVGHLMERALAAGALDCYFTPVQMKKNRPGVLVSVLCGGERREALFELLFAETTTLGVRSYEVERRALAREFVSVETEFGPVEIKVARLAGRVTSATPEYEQCRAAAERAGVPLRAVEAAARAAYARLGEAEG